MKTILVVDDNKVNLVTARTVLSNDYRVVPVLKGQQALDYLETGPCDIILLDIIMPEMDGFEVLEKIREMDHCRNVPVIFLTADDDVDTETRCFRAGAVDFSAKPFIPEVMISRICRALELEELRRSLADRLEQKTQEVSDIKSKAQKDALTGLWDRAYTEETVTGFLLSGTAGALLMMDIDNFKSVNDTYGHATGDRMLQALADILRETSREGDVVCRLGGDEFMVFLKDVTAKAQIRERAMDIIAQMARKIDELGILLNTSISIGIARTPKDSKEFAELYSCADKALYHVKRNGKNACHFFSDKLDDADGGQEPVDLTYLQGLLRRTDSGKGAYFLTLEHFRHVYNFIRRLMERESRDVSVLLFTLSNGADAVALEVLEQVINTDLRRSDVATQYSGRQIAVLLAGATRDDAEEVAQRILATFRDAYPRSDLRVDYETASLDDWLTKNAAKDSKAD